MVTFKSISQPDTPNSVKWTSLPLKFTLLVVTLLPGLTHPRSDWDRCSIPDAGHPYGTILESSTDVTHFLSVTIAVILI